MSTRPDEAGNPRRKWLSDVLQVLENDLRRLASAKETKGWYLAIGEVLTKAAQVYHGLGTIGFLSEGEELRDLEVQVLEAVAPLVIPHVRKRAPHDVCEMLDKLGVPAAKTRKSKHAATATFIAKVLAMADLAAKVRSYLSNREEATKWGIVNYHVSDAVTPAKNVAGGPPQPMPFYGVVDPLEIAEIAVRTAKRIKCAPYIMNELTEADPWPDPQVARERLNPLQISIDFRPVALYIERNWTPDHARRIIGQVFKVTDKLDDFLCSYETVVKNHCRDSLAWKRENNSPFFVSCSMIANEIAQWAADIRERAKERSPFSHHTPPAAPHQPAPLPDGAADPAIDIEEKAIILELRDCYPVLCTNYDLEAATHITRKTIGNRVDRLIAKRLAERPDGERKGVTLTGKGRELADRLRPKSTP